MAKATHHGAAVAGFSHRDNKMKTLERISQHTFLPGIVRKDGVTLDLGGNRGEFAGPLRERYGWDVVPVEPTPELAGHLRRQGFEVVEAAVTGEDGKANFTFDSGKELTGSVLSLDIVGTLLNDEDARKVVEVPAVSLATLIARQDRPVDLVKVDIEGAELDMFRKADDATLLSVRQFTVEFHDYWYPELAKETEKVKKRLVGLGFWMMRAGPNNKDILFVHPDHKPALSRRLYIGLWLRNLNGFGRAIRLLLQRLRG